jgi:glycosyltransferase involved in cell wall biosynthesis
MGVGLVLKVLHKKVIWDAHEHYPNAILDKCWIAKGLRRAVSRAFDLFERAVVRFFDYVIFTTPVVGARYERSKVRSGSVENYPIVALSQSPESERTDKMIYLGAMSRARGLVEVVEAFARVVKQHPTWKLSLVGSARPAVFAEELKALAKERGAGVHVEFVPWVPYDRKERLSSEASIGLVTYLPYSNNTSCLANKLFDYMLVGLPVIASDFPLYRQVVETSRCGLLVDPANPTAIAEAMTHLIEHPDEAHEMGENGRRAVLERYNWDAEGKKLLSIYEAVLHGPGGS